MIETQLPAFLPVEIRAIELTGFPLDKISHCAIVETITHQRIRKRASNIQSATLFH